MAEAEASDSKRRESSLVDRVDRGPLITIKTHALNGGIITVVMKR